MRSKVFGLLIVFALVLGVFGSALAKEAPKPFCGDLAAADCEILQKAQQATLAAASYKSTSNYALTLRGLPGLPSEETAVSMAIDGAFSTDEAAHSALQALSGLTQEEMRQALADSPELVVDIAKGWNFDLTLTVTIDAALAKLLSSQAGVTVPETLSLAARMVDGVLYYDATELAPFVGNAPTGWVGVPVAELAAKAQEQGLLAQTAAEMDPAAMQAAGATSAGGAAALVIQTALNNPEMLQKFMTIMRGDDTTVDGQTAAVFVSTFDWVAFLTSPEFSSIITDLVKSGALGDSTPAEADLQQGLQMLAMLGPTLFQGITSEATQTIGVDDFYQYAYSSTFSWDLAGLMQMAAMSGSLPAEMKPTTSDPSIKLVVDVADSDFSPDPSTDIVAPENAQMYTVEQFMGAGSN